MVPTLRDGDAILVRRGGRAPRPGDVVLARFRSRPDLLVVKRIRRAFDGGVGDMTVPPADSGWWLEGDNSFVTDDSRSYGPADIEGRVVLRYWPSPRRL